MNSPVKSKRHAMLGALFIAANEHGIDRDELRDNIVPSLIGRRLSAASEEQISQVLAHVAGPMKRKQKQERKQFPSSVQGLRDEIKTIAMERWPDTWSSSLNSLCRKFGVEHYNFLDVSHGRAVKDALIRMQSQGARHE